MGPSIGGPRLALRARPTSAQETRTTEPLTRSRTTPARGVERARIIRLASAGLELPAIAREWRSRASASGEEVYEEIPPVVVAVPAGAATTTGPAGAGGCHRGGPSVVFGSSPQLLKEEPMAPPRMGVVSWLRNQLQETNTDLLREMVATFAGSLMSAEADALSGAVYGERSPIERRPPAGTRRHPALGALRAGRQVAR